MQEIREEDTDVSKHVAVGERLTELSKSALFCYVTGYFKQNAGFDNFKAVFHVLSQSS